MPCVEDAVHKIWLPVLMCDVVCKAALPLCLPGGSMTMSPLCVADMDTSLASHMNHRQSGHLTGVATTCALSWRAVQPGLLASVDLSI